MPEPILEISNLSISFFTRYNEIPAVVDFNCRIDAGETMGLVGESGCGKSTVALALMRDLGKNGKIVNGSIRFRGEEIVTMDEARLRDIRGNRLAMIYQEAMASLNPTMRVGAQLMEVPLIHEGISRAEAHARSLTTLNDVRLPDPERVMDAYPHQLSGGQQQRIVIAMGLMSKPDLLILDEPTTALDVTVEAAIVELLAELNRKYGTAMLFISHNLGLIRENCDRLSVMYAGEVIEEGNVDDVFRHMHHPYTQALFRSIPLMSESDKRARPLETIPGSLPLPHQRPRGCYFAPRCRYFVEGVCDIDAKIPMQPIEGIERHKSRCVRLDEIDWEHPEAPAHHAEVQARDNVVLSVSNLRKHYQISANALTGGDTRVVKANEAISFELYEAETLAIVGESGCGKSTLAKVLIGLETATEGQAVLLGKNIEDQPIESRNAKMISNLQMVFQNPFDTLNPSITVGQQIIRSLEIFQVGNNDQERLERMLELLDLVRLPRVFAERYPNQLSGGQKQRVGIARSFAGQASVVIADEPVSALDVSVQAAVTELLMDIQRENGVTLIFISHDLSIVRYISDRVMVMYLGHVVEMGETEQVFAPPYHPYTEALLSAVPVADTRVKKQHITLEGDIPSAVNTPPGCPFQTRCRWKSQVADGLCDTEVPPMQTMADGHQIKCHLSTAMLKRMEPVFSVDDSPEAA